MTASSHPIIVIGSINTDMVVKAEVLPRPGQTVLGDSFFIHSGGKGANQAVAAARLGGNVSMVGNLGTDSFGDQAIQRLKSEGVDCNFITRDNEQPSGVALISVDALGENQIVVAPGANSTLTENHIDNALASLSPQSLILIQLEIPIDCVVHAIKLAKRAHCKVILDPAPAQPLPEELINGIFLLTPNKSEAECLTGITIHNLDDAKAAAQALVKRGAINVALTLGDGGVVLANVEGCELVPAQKTEAIDTTAAGDCFNGALAAALARNEPLRHALNYGCAAAAISVTRQGAQDSMPFQKELEQTS